MDNIPEKGVWSGRGIGIPSAGAIGGGDDYKQKIGRGKLPDFRTGSPTQGADSTFSSYLARVNKGYDDVYLDNLMFPEQEAEDEDIYDSDDQLHIRSKKLPRDFKIMRPRMRGIREMIFQDDKIVNNSRYSIVSSLREMSEEGEYSEYYVDTLNEGFGRWAIVKGIPRLAKSLGLAIPYLDVVLGAALAALSVYTIKKASDRLVGALGISEYDFADAISSEDEGMWEELMSKISAENTQSLKNDFNEFLEGIKSFFITILQSADTVIATGVAAGSAATGVGAAAVPFEIAGAQALSGGVGFSMEMVPVERWLFDMATHGAGVYEKIFEWLRSHGPESLNALRKKMEEAGGPLAAIMLNGDRSFRRLGDFYRALHDPKEATPLKSLAQDVKKGVMSQLDIPGTAPDSWNIDSQSMQLEGRGKSMRKRSKKVSIDQLREFIRESIYPDYESYHPAQPTGYEYRAVPTIISKAEADEEFSTLDNYDDFAVAYKTDGGIVAYQERNKLVKEQALRRLVKRGVLAIIEEDKKKRTSRRRR